MKNKPVLSTKSSQLCGTISLICFAVAAIFCKVFNATTGAAFFFILLVIFVLCRVWAYLSISSLSYSMHASQFRMWPGDEIEIQLSLTNEKTLPVVWAEIVQTFHKNNCLRPTEGLRALHSDEAILEGYNSNEMLSYCKRFHMILPGQKISHSYSMMAFHRGIYHPSEVLLRSGDGTGLAQMTLSAAEDQYSIFTVYPKLQPVQAQLFMQNLWNTQSSGHGYLDDPTLLRGTRPYQPGDSSKQINWRLAAMGLDLTTNIQEKLLPKNAHFIIDLESYNEPGCEDLLEDTLSLAASFIIELDKHGIHCGLSLPKGRNLAPVTIPALQPHTLHDLLYALSAYEPAPRERDEDNNLFPLKPSVFNGASVAGCIAQGERLYLISRTPLPLQSPTLRKLLANGVLLLHSQPAEGASPWKCKDINLLKKGLPV